jgi:hypothetical protein
MLLEVGAGWRKRSMVSPLEAAAVRDKFPQPILLRTPMALCAATIGLRMRTAAICRPTREIKMKESHNKAAELHESAAKSHRAAAESHGRNEHAKGKEHATQAQQHAQSANEQSKTANTKSTQQK